MKCVRCSGEITDEMDKCPKCKEYTMIKTEGTVSSEPAKEQAPNGETFVYFQVQTGEKELECEVKQGYESEIPVKKGDEVIIEFQKFKEKKETLRVRKLLNKTSDTLFNYSAGCLLPLVGLIMVLLTAVIML
jgi:hypothetical protein